MRACLFVAALLSTVGMAAAAGPEAGAGPDLFAAGAAECTITFDDVCPDTQRVCRSKFRGGAGCVVEDLPFCYASGKFSYKIAAADRLQIRFGAAISEIEIFFAQAGAGSGGQMIFFDENGLQVGGPLSTNGDCSQAMPDTQTVVFDRPVREARARAVDADVFIDSLRIVAD